MPLTESQARALYRAGEEAVVAFLLDVSRRLQSLEEQSAQNSGNSSKPPSSDGLSKPPLKPMPQSLRKKNGRKPGGQAKHEGKTLEAVAAPDQIIFHRPVCCQHCQGELSASAPVVTYCRRQVFEMPEPTVVVTEHRVLTLLCPGCHQQTDAAFPPGVAQPVQYGPHLLGFASYLHVAHLLPFARCTQIIQDVTGAPFCVGSLDRALRVAHDRLAPFEHRLKQVLEDVPLKHVDETGGRVAGKLHWFHVRCTDKLCWLFRHEKRGGAAVQDLLNYGGTLVSDFWGSYVSLSCQHVFCGAHLLRELTFISQVLQQSWAASLIDVWEDAVAACHAARERGAKRLWDASHFAGQFDWWVQEGLRANPPPEKGQSKSKARRLVERLLAYREDYVRFLFDLSLPFTNNEAERGVRMFKVKSKISGGFRTTEGADRFCRLRSYTATCQKQGRKVLDCLRSIFAGVPVVPTLNYA